MSVHNLYVWMQWILDYIYSVPLSVRISCQQNKYNSIRFPHVEIVHSVQEGLPLCIQDMKMDELFSKLIYFTFPASLTAHHSVNLLLNDIIVRKELVEFICIFIFSIHSSDICSGYSMKNSDALWRMERHLCYKQRKLCGCFITAFCVLIECNDLSEPPDD